MTAAEEITVDARGALQRLDRYLTAQERWGSRSQVQQLIAAGAVRVDGDLPKAGTRLRAGQRIAVLAPLPPAPAGVEAEPIPLDVLYEDSCLLVINKPAGMVVHPAPGHRRGTLVSALLHRWRGTPSGLDPTRPGIVHRLDRDTSGVLVIAKDIKTLAHLAAQFKHRAVEKQYVAFVWGHPQPRKGLIAGPIARNPIHRKRMAVRRQGREAETSYEVVEQFDEMALLHLFPKTGRTHQLRVHLASIGHPIVGDALYGRARPGTRKLIDRQALHAARLSFTHPQTGARMTFVAPEPADLAILRRSGRAQQVPHSARRARSSAVADTLKCPGH